jgi:hypothetical protein
MSDSDRDRPRILHCFADIGVESEALVTYGDVVRVGINARDTNESEPVKADAYQLPFNDDVTFDLGFFHPVCKRWASLTSISGDPEEHPNQIPRAREIGEQYCDHYVIENKPQAPLNDPVVLGGQMFGLPIAYERGFETTFRVPQPPRQKQLGNQIKVETSPFFFSERSKEWWASVKGYRADRYPKEHLAKNALPAPYVHYLCRAWLKVYEEENNEGAQRPDYSDYDEKMDKRRRTAANQSIYDYVEGNPGPDETLDTYSEGDE